MLDLIFCFLNLFIKINMDFEYKFCIHNYSNTLQKVVRTHSDFFVF